MEVSTIVIISIFSVIALLLLYLLFGVILRVMWDPIYCKLSHEGSIVRSAELLQVTTNVFVSERVVTSGTKWWCQRNLMKFSRMMIVICTKPESNDDRKQICLCNACSLINQLHTDLTRLGDVTHVVITNCFHYLYLHKYIESFPNATFIIPSGLFLKRPEFSNSCIPFPSGKTGSIFPETRFFPLPDFFQDHVIYVEEAELLLVSDSLVTQSPNAAPDPSYSSLTWLQDCIRCLSIPQQQQPVRFYNYTLQYRLASGADEASNTCWREIMLLPISRIVTAHGVYRGFVQVSQFNLDALMREITQGPSIADYCGRYLFSIWVLECCSGFFRDWTLLFLPNARITPKSDIIAQPRFAQLEIHVQS